MMNILLCGANGKMGHAVRRAIEDNDEIKIAAGVDLNTECDDFPIYDSILKLKASSGIDCIIDFSHPTVTEEVLDWAAEFEVPAVICTTGLSKEQLSKLEFCARKTPIFFSANMSVGVNLIKDLVCRAAKILDGFDIEITEKHHNKKIDAPSGTALALADALSEAVDYTPQYVYDRHSVRKKRDSREIGIHSLRGGNIVGEHTVMFAGNDEVIEIKHSATSKEVFASGAVKAALFMRKKPAALYSMDDLIKEW